MRFPRLERRDIKAVAVLSLNDELSKLGPCGACQEWFKKVTEVSPDLRILSFDTPQAETIYVKPALLT
jgi:cytidine deaminase